MSKLTKLETEMTVEFSTGMTASYKFSNDRGQGLITRTIMIPPDTETVEITAKDIEQDSALLRSVAEHFSKLPLIRFP